MQPLTESHIQLADVWDDEHVKALLHFPRFPARLIQQEPWQSWIGQRGGLKAVMDYLQKYPFQPSHRRILDVVLSTPESVADVYADRLNISRSTYFYQLRELVTAITQALNHWEHESTEVDQDVSQKFHSNLPIPLTNLVGAESILKALMRLLLRDDVHLLTLLGIGGIGKTRMSIELAHRLDLDTCFVDLSALSKPSQLPVAIAHCLGIKDETISGLKKSLKNREFLLILDNFERILPSRQLVSELLASAPRLKIIVTSRIPLQVYGEHEFLIPPLTIPDMESVKGQQLWAQSPAVSLFVQRAQSVNPSFSLNNNNVEAITELCQRMEGLPLAIELAAYQIKYYPPPVLLKMSRKRLDFLSQGSRMMPPHQQTIRAMLDWSFDLLSSDLQNLLCRLSTISKDFTIEEAEMECGITSIKDGITSLIDQSLLERIPCTDGEPRFKMLEVVREYACERLNKLNLQQIS